MSIWISKKDKSWKKILWQIDFDPMIILVVIGLIVTLIGPSLFRNPSIITRVPLGLLFVGVACLIISKMSLYKRGIWFSFGPGHMTKGYSKIYWMGYLLLGIGTLLLLAVFNSMSRT